MRCDAKTAGELWAALAASRMPIFRRHSLAAPCHMSVQHLLTASLSRADPWPSMSTHPRNCLLYQDDCVPGACALHSCRSLPTFQRCFLVPSSGRWQELQILFSQCSTSIHHSSVSVVTYFHKILRQTLVTICCFLHSNNGSTTLHQINLYVAFLLQLLYV
jgi:hypothetical protein